MNYHIAKKHSTATARVFHKCNLRNKGFQSFSNLREHKRKELGAPRGSEGRNVDMAHVMGDVADKSLKEEMKTCRHFLVDSGMEPRRHRVYNFAIDTLDPKNLLEKLDVVFDSLKYAAKFKVVFALVLKNVEDGSCR